MRAPCPRVPIVRACPASSCTCPVHTCAQALFGRGCHASSVYIDLSPCLLAYGQLSGCAHAPIKISRSLGPHPWSHCGDTYDWSVAASTLFVLTVTSSMHHSYLKHILRPTQYPCMQAPSITHSHPPQSLKTKSVKLCSKNTMIPLKATSTTHA